MLIFTRRTGESFMIGDDVVVTILKQDHRSVKIGVQAPKEIPIHREEIYNRIQQEKANGR